MRKLVCIGVVAVIIIGAVSGIASAKTLFVAAEDQIENSTLTPADVFVVDVKLTTYDNQCMTLTFSSEASVSGGTYYNIAFYPKIDGIPAIPTFAGITYWYAAAPDFWDMAAFTWYMCGLDRGRHTVAIQYNPANTGSTASVGARLLKIDIKSGKIVSPLPGAELEDEQMVMTSYMT